jgi:hypothetical protein
MPELPLFGPATDTFGGMMCGALSATSLPAWSYLQVTLISCAQQTALCLTGRSTRLNETCSAVSSHACSASCAHMIHVMCWRQRYERGAHWAVERAVAAAARRRAMPSRMCATAVGACCASTSKLPCSAWDSLLSDLLSHCVMQCRLYGAQG